MTQINYEYSTRTNALMHAKSQSSNLLRWDADADYECPIEDINAKAYMLEQWRPELITDALNKMEAGQCYITFLSKAVKEDHKEDEF